MIKTITIAGPTASGKTAFGIELAKICDGEIISADSQQVYEGLDIASAKPTLEEMGTIPHHMINVVPRTRNFSVAEYVEMANAMIEDVHKRGKMPIIVGGTGLYIDSLLKNIQFIEMPRDEFLRRELEETDSEELYKKLNDIDPQACEKIHMNNKKRVVRALEVYMLTGKTFTQLNTESKETPKKFENIYAVVTFSDREKLYNRIDERVEKMFIQGLVEEAREIYDMCSTPENKKRIITSNAAIGYKELLPYFSGISSLLECKEKIKQATRNYAKRQITWFRKNDEIINVNVENHSVYEQFLIKFENIVEKA